jgi:hypothetical protein
MNQSLPGSTSPAKRHKGRFWAYVPIALLAAMLTGFGVLIAIAVDDPGFAVEPDYYKKALSWDAKQEQDRLNRALAYELALSTAPAPGGVELTLAVGRAGGAPLTAAQVRVEAFHNARAAEIFDVELEEGPPGNYHGSLPIRRAGLWEFRVDVSHQGSRYTQTIRRDVVTR